MIWEAIGATSAILIFIASVLGTWIKRELASEARAREASSAVIIKGQSDLKDDLRLISDAMDKRVDRLETQARDFRPGAAIDAAVNHARVNVLQVIEGVKTSADRHGLAIDLLRDRMTVLETRHEGTVAAVNEMKSELRDTRHEINERFDVMTEVQRSQFEALAASIREIRTVAPKA